MKQINQRVREETGEEGWGMWKRNGKSVAEEERYLDDGSKQLLTQNYLSADKFNDERLISCAYTRERK